MNKAKHQSSLRTHKRVARRTPSFFTKARPSYKDSQNDEQGSYNKSKDGYAEKNPVEPQPQPETEGQPENNA